MYWEACAAATARRTSASLRVMRAPEEAPRPPRGTAAACRRRVVGLFRLRRGRVVRLQCECVGVRGTELDVLAREVRLEGREDLVLRGRPVLGHDAGAGVEAQGLLP